MKIKVEKDLKHPILGLIQAGTVIEIIDNDGMPTEIFWRNRLRDSAIDNVISIVENIILTTKKNK
jgi:hypothetical protein